jgi:cystathionine beta-lyase/cystathionine gamma-synthase
MRRVCVHPALYLLVGPHCLSKQHTDYSDDLGSEFHDLGPTFHYTTLTPPPLLTVDLTTTLPSLPQVQSLVNIGVTKEKEDNANAVLAAEKQRAQLVLNEAISNRDQAVADLNNVEERCVVVVTVVVAVAVAVSALLSGR